MDSSLKHKDDIAYFIAFCIEIYKHAHEISGAEASKIFCESRLTDFLENNFEVLHTQSPQWILEEINEYLNTNK